jgi:hypothetical protein
MSTINSLQKSIQADAVDELPKGTGYLFAPIDKRAFGLAIGITSALALALTTAVDLLVAKPWLGLNLLGNYFAGYSVSWPGVFIGAGWALAVGFVAGWLLAFLRNFSLAVSMFLVRTRAELDETSDFLDHI